VNMAPLTLKQHDKAYSAYLREKLFFPLIGAVLSGEQDGVVYADNPHDPAAIYVEHAFGFAQLFGERALAFERELEHYLLRDRSFSAAKARLYAPVVPDFLATEELRPLRSERQRFFPSATPANPPAVSPDVVVAEVSAANVDGVHSAFGVVDRFWRSPEDFVRKSLAVLVLFKGEPASLCYAAAIADNKAEIDVLTLPSFRGRGLGKLAVLHFVRFCREHARTPLWDCFTNNVASMALCASAGFRAEASPYAFFTIPKHP
jgi:RimJ/RimL family protein N-acetyltransferase